MKNFNIVAIFGNYNNTYNNDNCVLLCKKVKLPFLGMYNFPGGKIEEGEDHLNSAYRELEEETGITKDDTTLHHVMDIDFPIEDTHLELYCGILKFAKQVREEINPLQWFNSDDIINGRHNDILAGDGDIPYMMNYIKIFKNKIFGSELNN